MQPNEQQLLDVIAHTPLVSIDLVIWDAEGRVLLGLRNNEPAKDTWFVPGGRIRKDESLDQAFRRISLAEIDMEFHRSQARFIDVFEHRYDTNFQGAHGIGTHYIVLAYEVRHSSLSNDLPKTQHREYRWFSREEARGNPQVHRYVLPYFDSKPS